ncbi:MAG: acyltransferase [Chloroflexi bacterium]|nr:acyltransferase [Chloroflexota bacterium]
MRSRDGRIYSVQAFRAFAAVLVVFNHATVLGREILRLPEFADARALGLPEIANTFFFGSVRGSIRVDLFFVVSGFMVFYAYQKYLGDTSKIKTYLMRRVVRIYPLLWAFTLAKIALILAVPARAKPYETSATTMIASLFALPQDNLPLIAATWTLAFEMLFYVLFGLAIVAGARRAMMLAAAWASAIVVANVVAIYLVYVDQQSLSLPLPVSYLLYERNLEFLMGCAAAHLVRRRAIRRPGLTIVVGALGLAFSCALIARGGDLVSYALLVGLPSVLIVAGTAALELERRPPVPRLLTYVGDASYSIFVSHSTFINIFVIVMVLSGPWSVGPVSILLAMTVFAVLGGMAVYRVVEQPLTAALRRRLLEPRQPTPPEMPAPGGVPATMR